MTIHDLNNFLHDFLLCSYFLQIEALLSIIRRETFEIQDVNKTYKLQKVKKIYKGQEAPEIYKTHNNPL